MMPDSAAWLASVRRHVDALKVSLESNGRLDATARAQLASDAESLFKRARAMVEEKP